MVLVHQDVSITTTEMTFTNSIITADAIKTIGDNTSPPVHNRTADSIKTIGDNTSPPVHNRTTDSIITSAGLGVEVRQ